MTYPAQPAPAIGGFAAPAPPPPPDSGDRLQARSVVGHLLILVPTEFRPQFFAAKKKDDGTMGAPSDAIRVDVVDLDAIDQRTGQRGAAHTGVLWGARNLVGSLNDNLQKGPGTMVLARMGQSTSTPSANPSLELVDASADPNAVAVATHFLQTRPNWRSEQAAPAAAAPPAPPVAPAAMAPQMAPAPVAAQMTMPMAPAPAPASVPPAAWPTPAPVSAPAVPPAPVTMQQLDPAVLARLTPEAQAQLMAAYGQPA